jgi:hypothetical protein
MQIYCCECARDVEARLTDGREIYPHRADLAELPFWKCDVCKNYVGCHYKRASTRTKPLGCIPNEEVRRARSQIHAVLDPLWAGNKEKRNRIYVKLSTKLGREFHTAWIKTRAEADQVLALLKGMDL